MEARTEAAAGKPGVACCDVVNRGGSIDHGKYQQIAATGTTK
jgi:hypothetical protein